LPDPRVRRVERVPARLGEELEEAVVEADGPVGRNGLHDLRDADAETAEQRLDPAPRGLALLGQDDPLSLELELVGPRHDAQEVLGRAGARRGIRGRHGRAILHKKFGNLWPMITPLILLVSALASAQPADKGYVVRVDSETVWLDLTAADGAAPGRVFEIYTEGAELKHPVTGASLGRVQSEVAEGRVSDVDEKFSTGVLTARKGDVKAGQRARFTAAAPAAVAPKAAQRPGEPESRAPKTMGATIPYE